MGFYIKKIDGFQINIKNHLDKSAATLATLGLHKAHQTPWHWGPERSMLTAGESKAANKSHWIARFPKYSVDYSFSQLPVLA